MPGYVGSAIAEQIKASSGGEIGLEVIRLRHVRQGCRLGHSGRAFHRQWRAKDVPLDRGRVCGGEVAIYAAPSESSRNHRTREDAHSAAFSIHGVNAAGDLPISGRHKLRDARVGGAEQRDMVEPCGVVHDVEVGRNATSERCWHSVYVLTLNTELVVECGRMES